MNEKLQYASMLEIPVNTCNVTFKPQKKKRGKKRKIDNEQIKQELLDKVNFQVEESPEPPKSFELQEGVENLDEQPNHLIIGDKVGQQENLEMQDQTRVMEEQTISVSVKKKVKKPFKISVIGVQLFVIGALIATIFLTNALYVDSGINVFLRSVFGTEQASNIDERKYDEFSPVISLDDGASLTLVDGIMTLSGKGSVYASCDGVVTKCELDENGKYTIEIAHNKNFKSILSGIDYAYAGLNDKIYYNIPVGYVKESATMCFLDGESVVTDYQIVNEKVVWEA